MTSDDEALYDGLLEDRTSLCEQLGGIRAAQDVAIARVAQWIMDECASPTASQAIKDDLKNAPKRKAAHLKHLARLSENN